MSTVWRAVAFPVAFKARTLNAVALEAMMHMKLKRCRNQYWKETRR
jgi:hypothetical protein